MADVTRLPTAHALANVPHMLRHWADVIERDTADGVQLEFAALTIIQAGEAKPAFFIADRAPGMPPHPLFAAGVFDYCRQQLINDAARVDDEG
ncbi:hypothetical protein [uncultured Luteimonas sp.]|uniref:hypothetical protein n=1 Tax=uncultured Luteimonas sp. TaxID=453144 RepID=UPI002633FA24|nr:hypothetical protein [uncultured Luteimonas sp.]